MRKTYSIYEAKSHFSAILRRVREGTPVVISHHGRPVAEIRPMTSADRTAAERWVDLVERGIIVPSATPRRPVRTLARRPGALRRFLRERD
jgi:prevent-host-death family protein